MGYSSGDYGPTTKDIENQSAIPNSTVTSVFNTLGIDPNTYLENTGDLSNKLWLLPDIIALAKTAGKSDAAIANALSTNKIRNPLDKENKNRWWSEAVTNINLDSAPNTNLSTVQNYLDTYYKDWGARVEVGLSSNGKQFVPTVVYTDPATGKSVSVALTDLPNNPTNTDIAELFNHGNPLNVALQQYTNSQAKVNAQADSDLAQTVLNRLNEGGLKNANAYNDLSEADRAAITAALPSTEDLSAWNQTKDSTVFSTLIKNLQKDNPELLQRISYDKLKNISDAITDEQQSVTERGITNQRTNLLQNIAKDSTLYNQLIQQQRADNATGTIAGQRAANTQAVAEEDNANYAKQASELYSNLFGGEKGNIAQQTYSENYGNSVSTLDTIIQGKLDDAVNKENLRASQITELESMLQALADATGVDVARWADAISESQAEAGGKASSLVSTVQGNLTTAQSDNSANIDKIRELFGEGSSYVKQGSSSGSDVSDAVATINDALAKAVASSGYKTVSPGNYEKAEQFANKQYSDLVTSAAGQEFIKQILDDKTIDSFTKQQTIEDYMTSNNLDDLTLDGLTAYYTGYNKEATEQSNKIFNQAQRAYIAAITAGDAKTAEQLTRLASTAGASKGNLYAASALANQFKQQTGLNTSGRQLATDFLNQQSFNSSNEYKAQRDAATAQLKYLGSGNQQSNGATLYEAYNKAMQNKANATGAYSKFGSSVMGSNQDMSSWAVKNNIDNWNNLVDVASSYTAANAAGAATNNEAQGAIETLRAQALAKQKQASQILGK